MTDQRASRSKVNDREQRLEKLLTTMGMGEANPFTRYSVTQELERIERDYRRRTKASAKQPDRKMVRRYRALIAKLLALSEAIGSDFFADEIERAGWSRHNPRADERTLSMLLAEHGRGRDDVAGVLRERGLNVDHWLDATGDPTTYRRREVRKAVVEPFLRLMADQGITTSRKQRPRKQVFDALFDWLQVDRKFRPSSANIDAIARVIPKRSSEP